MKTSKVERTDRHSFDHNGDEALRNLPYDRYSIARHECQVAEVIVDNHGWGSEVKCRQKEKVDIAGVSMKSQAKIWVNGATRRIEENSRERRQEE